MTRKEIITLAIQRTGHGQADKIGNETLDIALNELNLIYERIWRSYPWREIRDLHVSISTSTGIVVVPNYVDRIMSVRQGDDPIYPANVFRINHLDPDWKDSTGTVTNFHYSEDSPVSTQPSASDQFTVQSSNTTDTGKVLIRYEDGNGNEGVEELTLTGENPVTSSAASSVATLIRHISKDQTSGWVTVKEKTAGTTLAIIPATHTLSQYRQLQLLKSPSTVPATFHIHATRKFQPLMSDTESSVISGMDSALVEGLTSALWRWKGNEAAASTSDMRAVGAVGGLITAAEDIDNDEVGIMPVSGHFGNGATYPNITITGV
jgi:hypothetical protein